MGLKNGRCVGKVLQRSRCEVMVAWTGVEAMEILSPGWILDLS